MITFLIIYLSGCVLNLVMGVIWLYIQNESYEPVTKNDIFMSISFILTSFIGSMLAVSFIISDFIIFGNHDKPLS